MSKKFLKSLNFDDTKIFVFQNDTLKSWIDEEKWNTYKANGIKMTKISEKSKPICDKIMETFNLN